MAAIYLVFARPSPARLIIGSVVALTGLALRAASAGHVEKNRKLAVSGPYAYSRNPLYLGSALAGLGFCIAGGRWWFFLLLAVFFVLVYVPVMRREEVQLTTLFGNEYADFAAHVPLLFPRLRPWRSEWVQAAVPGFNLKLYLYNREYEALLAFLLIVLALWGKMAWGI